MVLATSRSPEFEQALGPGAAIIMLDKVSLAFDDNVILNNVSFTLLTGHT